MLESLSAEGVRNSFSASFHKALQIWPHLIFATEALDILAVPIVGPIGLSNFADMLNSISLDIRIVVVLRRPHIYHLRSGWAQTQFRAAKRETWKAWICRTANETDFDYELPRFDPLAVAFAYANANFSVDVIDTLGATVQGGSLISVLFCEILKLNCTNKEVMRIVSADRRFNARSYDTDNFFLSAASDRLEEIFNARYCMRMRQLSRLPRVHIPHSLRNLFRNCSDTCDSLTDGKCRGFRSSLLAWSAEYC